MMERESAGKELSMVSPKYEMAMFSGYCVFPSSFLVTIAPDVNYQRHWDDPKHPFLIFNPQKQMALQTEGDRHMCEDWFDFHISLYLFIFIHIHIYDPRMENKEISTETP